MTFNDHVGTFAGLPVVRFEGGKAPDVDDPAAVAWRVEVDWDDGPEEFAEVLDGLVSAVGAAVTALVVGLWGSVGDYPAPVDALAARAGTLPNLRALFLGDLIPEECEISWIQHGDLTPLVEALPRLEILTVRGGEGLQLRPVRHEGLRDVVFESGGLPAGVVRGVGASDLPNVTSLELWLGTDNYGGDATVADLADLLGGSKLPALTGLGLRNCEIADDVAAAVAGAPVVARLKVLDLSMGVLTDRGAAALLAGQPLTHLAELRLWHHYLSTAMMERLVAELPGVAVDLDEQLDDEGDDRWIAVSE
jgi:hypothetical protein